MAETAKALEHQFGTAISILIGVYGKYIEEGMHRVSYRISSVKTRHSYPSL